MKKYNLSKIMKRAWSLVKTAGLSISEGLKKAWREAKNMGKITKGSAKQIKWAESIKADMITALKMDRDRCASKGKTKWVAIREKNLEKIEEIDDARCFIDTFVSFRDFYGSRVITKTEEKDAKQYSLRIGAEMKELFGREVFEWEGKL